MEQAVVGSLSFLPRRHPQLVGELMLDGGKRRAMASAASAQEHYNKAEAELKALWEEQAAHAQRLQRQEEDLKAHEAKLADRDSKLAKVVTEQVVEHECLEVLHAR